MAQKRLDPHDQRVTDAVIEMISKMSSQEALDFLMRDRGVEETDMTAAPDKRKRAVKRSKSHAGISMP